MITNGRLLRERAPIRSMLDAKHQAHGTSYGLGEAGYDLRLAQTITFIPRPWWKFWDDDKIIVRHHVPIMGGIRGEAKKYKDIEHKGRFVLASAMEEFHMPESLACIVHDKSTWARHGVSVFNTVIEPGWGGFLTLEIVFHGRKKLVLERGCGIAQAIFHELAMPARYDGKYQNQERGPVEARS